MIDRLEELLRIAATEEDDERREEDVLSPGGAAGGAAPPEVSAEDVEALVDSPVESAGMSAGSSDAATRTVVQSVDGVGMADGISFEGSEADDRALAEKKSVVPGGALVSTDIPQEMAESRRVVPDAAWTSGEDISGEMAEAGSLAVSSRRWRGLSAMGPQAGGVAEADDESGSIPFAVLGGVEAGQEAAPQPGAVLDADKAAGAEHLEDVAWMTGALSMAWNGGVAWTASAPMGGDDKVDGGFAIDQVGEAEKSGMDLGAARSEDASGLERLYRETVRAAEPMVEMMSAGQTAGKTLPEPVLPGTSQMTVEELDRAMRRDSRRYDGGMTIF